MINVTLTITGAELGALRDAAEKAFPNELSSRGEITRRFALAGIAATNRLTEEATRASLVAAHGGSGGRQAAEGLAATLSAQRGGYR